MLGNLRICLIFTNLYSFCEWKKKVKLYAEAVIASHGVMHDSISTWDLLN